MPNLRIVYQNAADDNLSLTASSTAGSLAASNLLTDIKSEVWRSTGLTESLTVTWTDARLIGCVALPFCNFTSTATIRVRGYTNVGDASPVFDTGAVPACAYAPFGLWDWGLEPLGVNAFSYGGGAYANVWISPNWVKQLTIDLVDADNAAGYIEAARLVAGSYFEPTYNADYGAEITYLDSSIQSRTDAGDLMTDVGTRARKISLNLSMMPTADRAELMKIIKGNGKSRPIYFSLFPENDDPELEQTYQIYCKLSDISAVTAPYFGAYSAPIELEEI